MASTPKPGTKVTWSTPQGETHGTVEKTVTGTQTVKGHTAHASKKQPQLLVRSDKTGKEAVHKPEALKTSR